MRQLLVITFGVCETLRDRLVIAMPLFDVVVVVADVAALRLKKIKITKLVLIIKINEIKTRRMIS